jgi:membrane associated rhomboid family serine protease
LLLEIDLKKSKSPRMSSRRSIQLLLKQLNQAATAEASSFASMLRSGAPQRAFSSAAATAARRGSVEVAARTAAKASPTGRFGGALWTRWTSSPHHRYLSISRTIHRQQSRGYSRYMTFPSRGVGGWWNPDDASKVVWGLIAANAAVFMLWRVDPVAAQRHFVISADSLAAGRYHTLLTSAVSHADFGHLASNLICLYFFSQDVGRIAGGRNLMLLYAAGGVAGSAAHVGWEWWKARQARARYGHRTGAYLYGRRQQAQGALGASAAVNAVMTTSILLFPKSTVMLYGTVCFCWVRQRHGESFL